MLQPFLAEGKSEECMVSVIKSVQQSAIASDSTHETDFCDGRGGKSEQGVFRNTLKNELAN